ncbi:MAG TPA: hypothetical protein VJ945_06915, partial [Flavobacteriaceae bacterium]|nr:hypothetical protein [Flavobacteriaceae bacterium]
WVSDGTTYGYSADYGFNTPFLFWSNWIYLFKEDAKGMNILMQVCHRMISRLFDVTVFISESYRKP